MKHEAAPSYNEATKIVLEYAELVWLYALSPILGLAWVSVATLIVFSICNFVYVAIKRRHSREHYYLYVELQNTIKPVVMAAIMFSSMSAVLWHLDGFIDIV